eukprot:914349-Pyramimonas_sp.AAC.1
MPEAPLLELADQAGLALADDRMGVRRHAGRRNAPLLQVVSELRRRAGRRQLQDGGLEHEQVVPSSTLSAPSLQ